MKPVLRTLASLLCLVAILSSCENVFTTSPVAFLQRDPAGLSPEQQVEFGKDALASGDAEQMAAAYELLKESDDPRTQLLAAELALGAAGLESAVIAAAGDLSGGADAATVLEEVLSGFTESDLALMSAAAALIDEAEDSVTPSPEQYTFAAIGLIAIAIDANGGSTVGLDALGPADPGYDEAEQAKAFLQAATDSLQAAGESTDLLDELGAVIGML